MEVLGMSKPSQDPNSKRTRHLAADAECCQKMAKKYGWIQDTPPTEQSGDRILPLFCVFLGDCQFPPSFYDPTESEEDE